MSSTFVHETAVVDEPVEIGAGAKIWHFCHVMAGAVIGENSSLGQGCFVASRARVGRRVRVQNNVSLYDGVELEDDVFVGPSAVFTNVDRPRGAIDKRDEFRKTLVRQGATIGANATITPGVVIGRYAFVGAGAVVTGDVVDFALVVGVPAHPVGWVSRHGEQLAIGADGRARCTKTGESYRLIDGRLELVE
jgi:UDP-2-acetamido-3-amino-2,3-dideoxy-glucuronate N-acetyltransferase